MVDGVAPDYFIQLKEQTAESTQEKPKKTNGHLGKTFGVGAVMPVGASYVFITCVCA